jgi:hypothetical protein
MLKSQDNPCVLVVGADVITSNGTISVQFDSPYQGP